MTDSPRVTVAPTPAPTRGLTFQALTPSLFPWLEDPMDVHTIVIVIIFCMVCLLLLLAFFYAFCFRCTMEPLPKERRAGSSLDREDATFRRSSSDGQELGNVV